MKTLIACGLAIGIFFAGISHGIDYSGSNLQKKGDKGLKAKKTEESQNKSGLVASTGSATDEGKKDPGLSSNEKEKSSKGEEFGITPGFSYGIISPLWDYGIRYENSAEYSVFFSFARYSFVKIIPEIFFRYSKLESKERREKVDSSISLLQVSAGFRFPHNVRIKILAVPVMLYGRLSEGITRVAFTSDNYNNPIVEYINTLEAGAGFVLPVYRGIETGVDFGYRYISTKNVPLQSLNLSVFMGVRI